MSFSEICARYKKYVAIQNDMFGLCPIQKNGAIQKDLVEDNEWSPYKCRCDIFVVSPCWSDPKVPIGTLGGPYLRGT
jgi:hypothetical protein